MNGRPFLSDITKDSLGEIDQPGIFQQGGLFTSGWVKAH
jgi:hypothetical protein